MPRRQRRAAEIGQLLGMEFYRQAERLCLREQPLDLLRRKGDALAEPVDGVDQPLPVRRLQPRQDHLVEIGLGASAIFRRHRMGGEIAGDDADWA